MTRWILPLVMVNAPRRNHNGLAAATVFSELYVRSFHTSCMHGEASLADVANQPAAFVNRTAEACIEFGLHTAWSVASTLNLARLHDASEDYFMLLCTYMFSLACRWHFPARPLGAAPLCELPMYRIPFRQLRSAATPGAKS